MEEKIFSLYKRIVSNKIYLIATDIIFPFALIIMSLVNVNKGIDITDSTYSLSNAMFVDGLDSSWYFPTLYSNLFLRILMFLPGGSTLLGINIYTSVIKGLMALAAYYVFIDVVQADRLLVFGAEITALGLCWCPAGIVYNYLTYFLFFAGTALLFTGLKKGEDKYLLHAGIMLGTNFFVRFPNIVEVALILVVWFEAALNKRKFAVWGKRTLACVGGFFIAFIPAIILIAVTRGFSEYLAGISDLFAMTDNASAYSGAGMLKGIIYSYIHTWYWFEHVILLELMVLLGCLVFPKKLAPLRYVVSTLITLGLLLLLYKKALFSFDYHTTGAIYGLGKVIVCLAIILFVIVLFLKKESNENKVLAFTSLLVIALTPLGTNNEVYANLNNMFWVLPVFLYLLCRFETTNEYVRGVRWSILILTCALAFQAFFFGITYKFRDGVNDSMNVRVSNNRVLTGMYTTSDNAKLLEEVGDIWSENSLKDGTVLMYGNVCGIGYIFETRPAISSSWPSLPSYLESTFESEMKKLSDGIDSGSRKAPVVVIGAEEIDGILEGATVKQEILKIFLDKYAYNEIYNSERLSIYIVEQERE